jgi:hypothetical protein
MGIPFGDVVMANEAALAKKSPNAVKDVTFIRRVRLSKKPIMKPEYPNNGRCLLYERR